ncbi:AAA family ATPase [Ramlibacter alkalitolerans]|uniref:AAA family ATPase n=1 Tax=Ramlibacter alkalitolerans TaxID=2039631 RepID=A0ABS1JU43_9BURK|nr:AAA family ATPase [Ramlibacter alkalitolerans]MBL0427747.1 AAA family ATPase [Ramlibacter alkalitolerans]
MNSPATQHNPVVVNFFAGPGAGKTTTAARVFADLKAAGYEAEYVPEFAKVATWAGHTSTLQDQLYLFAKQNNRLEVLRKQPLDFIIMDSPLLMCLAYTPPNYFPAFRDLVLQVSNSYDNRNFLLERTTRYSPVGRNETEDQAREKCRQIREVLESTGVVYRLLKDKFSAAEEAVASLLSDR